MAQKVELLNIITEHDTKLIARLTSDMESIAAERQEIEGQKEVARAPTWKAGGRNWPRCRPRRTACSRS